MRLHSLRLPDWQADTRRSLERRREVRGVGCGRVARSLYVVGDQSFTHLRAKDHGGVDLN